jgi:hypothetical protein
MTSTDTQRQVVQIGVFAAENGWLLTHPRVQSRFEDREEAMAAAKRLAHLESWRGREVDMLVQESLSAEVASFDPRR